MLLMFKPIIAVRRPHLAVGLGRRDVRDKSRTLPHDDLDRRGITARAKRDSEAVEPLDGSVRLVLNMVKVIEGV